MMRGLTLYKIWSLTWLHRLRHDLGRELTVLAASAVMFATFLYVFNDFLNVQVATIAEQMRTAFARALTLLVLTIVCSSAVYWLGRRNPSSVEGMARQLGEDDATVKLFVALRSATILIFWHSIGWSLSRAWLEKWSIPATALAEAILLVVTFGYLVLQHRWPKVGWLVPTTTARIIETDNALAVNSIKSRSQTAVLTSWRLTQILRRNRICRTFIMLALPFVGLVMLSASRNAPPFVALVAALAAGYLFSATLSAQMAEDLRHAWLERGLGVSHETYLKAYQRTAMILAAMIGILSAAAYFIGGLAAPQSGLLIATLLIAAKAGAVAAVPSLISPCLLLQVDGRRLAVTLPVNLIVSLFIGTAVIAHWLGLILVPILINTANSSQAGRFYRA